VNPWQRAALVAVAVGAFWVGRADAECAALNYSVQMKLAATTPKDDSWPASVELTQIYDNAITWTAPAAPGQTVRAVDLEAWDLR
jgi:hypothetical protein